MDSRISAGSWIYDVTLALAVGAAWWISEYTSFASQRNMRFISDLNIVWSWLVVFLGLSAVGALVLEQIILAKYQLSIPTTVSTIVAASLSYIVLQERLCLFDREARIVQKLMRVRRLRFRLNENSRGFRKILIVWRIDMFFVQYAIWRRGSFPTDLEVLPNQSVERRLGNLRQDDVVSRMRAKGMEFDVLLGFLLFFWLPTASFERLQFGDRWARRRKLELGFVGLNGRVLGLPHSEDFSSWCKKLGASKEHFALIVLEYPKASRQLIDFLPRYVEIAETPQYLAEMMLRDWYMLVSTTRC